MRKPLSFENACQSACAMHEDIMQARNGLPTSLLDCADSARFEADVCQLSA